MPEDWPAQLDAHEAQFDADALGVAAAEYVAAEARVEPYWKSLLGLLCCLAIVAAACLLIYALGG